MTQSALRLARVVSRDFGATGHYAPAVAGYLADLARLHDLPHRASDFDGAARTTFTDMVRAIVDEVAAAPVDLVVLAHSTPDAEPGWPASFLAGALPGEPLSFAVADQGVAAPFTALRIVQAYGVRRALVLLLDQTTYIQDPAGPARNSAAAAARNSLVALVLDRDGELGDLSAWTVVDVSAAEVPTLLPEGAVLGAQDGRQLTDLWRDLDTRLADGRPVVLATYEPSARCLGVCTVEPRR